MMEDYRKLIKGVVAFGVPLNEQNWEGTALDALLFEGGSSFNDRSELSRHIFLFIFSDLVNHGSDLTQDVSRGFRVGISWVNNTGEGTYVRWYSDYLSTVARQNIYEGMSTIPSEAPFLVGCQWEELSINMSNFFFRF